MQWAMSPAAGEDGTRLPDWGNPGDEMWTGQQNKLSFFGLVGEIPANKE